MGFTGGTLDKLESIPGFRTNLTTEQFRRQLGSIGLVVSGQSAQLAPADGKLYALRDVTATVDSLPLIASSIMSKDCRGRRRIVLDVKAGRGAFMETEQAAVDLASLMVQIGEHGTGRRVCAVISDMDQPLGHAVGNTLELQGPSTHCAAAAHRLPTALPGCIGPDAAARRQGRQ